MKKKNIDRRNFLKTTGTVIAGSTLVRRAFADPAGQAASATNGRMILPINRNWRYSRSVVEGGHEKTFDDSAFERVVVPHTNIKLPWHSFDDKSYQVVSIYRRRFKLPPEASGRLVFVDFEGAMTASTVWINGVRLGEYKGGYTPFSLELTPHLDFTGENVLAVDVDSTERPDIPPFGHQIDYLTFGGIYREVALRIVPSTFLENIFAKPKDVLTPHPRVEVDCYVQHLAESREALTLEAELRDGERVLAKATGKVPASLAATEPVAYPVVLENLGSVKLWDLRNPTLYSVHVRLLGGRELVDSDSRKIGFREAQFTDHGFELNGKVLKLRGLDRHQTFPFVGQAMPARVQRRDAEILRRSLHCNIVRTSHYPQSPHFLDACDEYGLLVFEEIPGWQHIGNDDWQKLALQNVEKMIQRDWNHPSIILWGVRINESGDNYDLYTKTNALAHSLDDSRQTGGVRYRYGSERLEDVFTMNDFGFPLRPPNHPLYLNTEFNGHMYPTKRNDNVERLREHTHRHARVHDQLASDDKYAGGLGWCAFDYNTHDEFGSGDRICYHGVSDIFRIPKPAAGFYKSQCDPSEEIVLEPAFDWARGDENETFTNALVCSNCEKLRFYIGERLIAEVEPDRKTYPHLKFGPFVTNLRDGIGKGWSDLRIEGYISGKKVIERTMSAKGVDRQLLIEPDDREIVGDGIDMTRVVMKVTDEFG